MSVIKQAFIEGRETENSWDESTAKQNDIKLQVAMENMESWAKREKLAHKPIPIEQICPQTGKVLRSFPNRLDAAKWIVVNVLKAPHKNPVSVTGNMEMCMRAGWKSYGYYWRISKSLVGKTKIPLNKNNFTIFVKKGRKLKQFTSFTSAALFLDTTRTTLTTYLKKYGECEVDGFHVRIGGDLN